MLSPGLPRALPRALPGALPPRRIALSLSLLLGLGLPLASPAGAREFSWEPAPQWAQAPSGGAPLPAPGRGPLPPRLSEAQARRLFPEIRRLAVDDHRARIAILRQGERCSGQAADGDALRLCMRQERTLMQNQRQQYRDAVRALMVRNGVLVPDRQRRGGAGSGSPEGAADGWDRSRPAL